MMFCPVCFELVWNGSACDRGEQDNEGGTVCPYCHECVRDSEWLEEPPDAHYQQVIDRIEENDAAHYMERGLVFTDDGGLA